MAAAAVTTSPLIRQYTLEEFWALEHPPEGGHYELIAGVLSMVPPPDGLHLTAVARLNRLFSGYLAVPPELGELFVPRTAIWTSARTYLEPDLTAKDQSFSTDSYASSVISSNRSEFGKAPPRFMRTASRTVCR